MRIELVKEYKPITMTLETDAEYGIIHLALEGALDSDVTLSKDAVIAILEDLDTVRGDNANR